jgi:putative hydrolase of the HAD superfamily
LAAPRAILFDLDDTILDDTSSVEPSWRAVCGDATNQIDGLDGEALLVAIDRTRKWFWRDAARHREGRLDLRAASARIVNEALLSLGLDMPARAKAIADAYRDLREAAVRPFPGALETLERLRENGTRLALITNGSARSQRAKVERFDLESHFDCVLIEGEFGAGKPERRVYEAALRALGSEPRETWSVGDNLEWDVAAPQRLGLYAVWVDHRGAGLPAEAPAAPDRIVRFIRELV